MPINYGAQGDQPGPMGDTPNADGQDMAAPMDMGKACQAAADASMAHCEAEARKVAMGMGPIAE
ncbi:MAG TPA: hypothetical protein VIV12_11515 [Streptosporangiaceae bacterium]